MSKKDQPKENPENQERLHITIEAKPKRTRKYTFPDIDGGGPSVTIDATSIEEATALFRKGHASSV